MDNQAYITEQTLSDFGISLGNEDKASLLAHLNDTLQERIGNEITAMLDDNKLEELVTLQENAPDEQIGAWLGENVPELQEIIEDEIDILMGELAESRDSINKAA